MVEGKLTPTEYIQHHLVHWQYSFTTHSFGPAKGFWVLNMDTLLVSIVLGVFFCWSFWRAARKVSIDRPSKLQNFAELCVEQVETLVRESFHDIPHKLVGPMALTVFMWVFLMNFMDLIPVDVLPMFMHSIGASSHFKSVPTADLNMTFAMSISVFLLIILFNITSKKLGLLTEIALLKNLRSQFL